MRYRNYVSFQPSPPFFLASGAEALNEGIGKPHPQLFSNQFSSQMEAQALLAVAAAQCDLRHGNFESHPAQVEGEIRKVQKRALKALR